MRYFIVLLFIIGAFAFFFYFYQTGKLAFSQTAQPVPSVDLSQVLGQQTKTTDCKVNGPFPDKACTPGDAFSDATVQEICVPGYTKSVRNVSVATKKEIYAEYGIASHTTGEYEVDHFIPLEIGGSNDPSNLFPEAAAPKPGFHEKDEVENYLHEQVCSSKLRLQDAQAEIVTNWITVYNRIPNLQQYNYSNWSGK